MVSESESDKDQPMVAKKEKNVLSEAVRARVEHSRRRALELRASRLSRPREMETGGGFLRPETEELHVCAAPSAPFVHRSEQPQCLECDRSFPQSYLLETFDYNVCDDCRIYCFGEYIVEETGCALYIWCKARCEGLDDQYFHKQSKLDFLFQYSVKNIEDDEEAHRLVPRTEAKSEFLLKDCDLDARPPPLRCVRRANPHRTNGPAMRLYLRAQLLERALLVWGSLERLAEERAARDERRARVAAGAARRRMRALRMDVRSSLYDRTCASHTHAFGPETHDPLADLYSRECACGHVETYEKM